MNVLYARLDPSGSHRGCWLLFLTAMNELFCQMSRSDYIFDHVRELFSKRDITVIYEIIIL